MYQTPNEVVPSKVPEIQILKEGIFKELERLTMEIDGLNARLNAVMRPMPQENRKDGSKVSVPVSPLADDMQKMLSIITENISKLNQIKESLDL